MSKKFLDTMNYILAKPATILGETDINLFRAFIIGFMYSRDRPDESGFLEVFHRWAAERYNHIKYDKGKGWADLFMQMAKELTPAVRKEQVLTTSHYVSPNFDRQESIALYLMAEAWDDFIKECPKDKYPYDSDEIRKLRPFRSIDAPWQVETQTA